ncbi:hypothetical protein [Flavobacterium fluviatile]|uniref:hypothetical protein n=1 Tax=Flavobacterium fluviatile TaxID=1862387 RepID=UPI0013D4EE24|nr:hypothetical protein [Flavobacterium fluviatile]
MGGTSLYGAWSPNWTTEKALASEIGEARQGAKLYAEHLSYIRQQLERLTNEGKRY